METPHVATAVTFGAQAAMSYVVESDTTIRAVSPPSKTLNPASVVVTTIAGSATAPQPFDYEGCLVPKLHGKKLKAAKKKLRKSDCKIGKVRKIGGATAKTGTVVKQNPKPGKVLAPGSKVSVKLG